MHFVTDRETAVKYHVQMFKEFFIHVLFCFLISCQALEHILGSIAVVFASNDVIQRGLISQDVALQNVPVVNPIKHNLCTGS